MVTVLLVRKETVIGVFKVIVLLHRTLAATIIDPTARLG